jgi:hypothetical protein
VELEITPEPSDAERQAILASLDGAGLRPEAYASRWRESGLDDLRGDASAEDAGRDPRVVEP